MRLRSSARSFAHSRSLWAALSGGPRVTSWRRSRSFSRRSSLVKSAPLPEQRQELLRPARRFVVVVAHTDPSPLGVRACAAATPRWIAGRDLGRAAAPRPPRPSGSPAAACRRSPPSPPTPRSRCRRACSPPHALAAVVAHARQHDGEQVCAEVLGRRVEHAVDRRRVLVPGRARREPRHDRRPRGSRTRGGGRPARPARCRARASRRPRASRARHGVSRSRRSAKPAREALRHVLRDHERAVAAAR